MTVRTLALRQDGFRRFGANDAVGTTLEDVWDAGGVYPWPTTAETLRIRSGGNVADTAAGAGAREISVTYLDENWREQTETLATAGASASSATTGTARRLVRAWVTDVGAYTAANTGNILIENTSTAQLLGQISAGFGQTQMTIYTVPADVTAYLVRYEINVDGTQAADVQLYQRQNADTVAAPFTGKRLVSRVVGVTGDIEHEFRKFPQFPPKTDVWFAASAGASTTKVVAQYDLEFEYETV